MICVSLSWSHLFDYFCFFILDLQLIFISAIRNHWKIIGNRFFIFIIFTITDRCIASRVIEYLLLLILYWFLLYILIFIILQFIGITILRCLLQVYVRNGCAVDIWSEINVFDEIDVFDNRRSSNKQNAAFLSCMFWPISSFVSYSLLKLLVHSLLGHNILYE